jgi:hypothetical protein
MNIERQAAKLNAGCPKPKAKGQWQRAKGIWNWAFIGYWDLDIGN